jgi:predicted PurR-regulated permease PerM
MSAGGEGRSGGDRGKGRAPDEPVVLRTPVDIRSVALTVLAVIGTVLLLQHAYLLFIPIVVGLLLAYALSPAVGLLERVRVPRIVSAALVMLVVLGGVGSLGYALRSDAAAVVEQLPEAARQLRAAMRERPAEGEGTIEKVQEAAQEIEAAAAEASPATPPPRGVTPVQVVEPAIDVRSQLYAGSMSALMIAAQAVLVLFLVFFILASGDLYKRKLVSIAGPSMASRRLTVEILDDINRQIERFLVVRLVASAVVALASWLAFRWMGLEQAGIWAIGAGILNTIPYFGPIVVAAGVAVVGFVQFGTLAQAGAVSAVSLAITGLEGWLLTPWLASRATQMNPVAIFVGLVFWTWVWGVWGTVLAVPMLTVVKAICDRIEGLTPVGELLGS